MSPFPFKQIRLHERRLNVLGAKEKKKKSNTHRIICQWDSAKLCERKQTGVYVMWRNGGNGKKEEPSGTDPLLVVAYWGTPWAVLGQSERRQRCSTARTWTPEGRDLPTEENIACYKHNSIIYQVRHAVALLSSSLVFILLKHFEKEAKLELLNGFTLFCYAPHSREINRSVCFVCQHFQSQLQVAFHPFKTET